MVTAEHWKAEPDEHDFPAALDYLSLIVTDAVAQELVEALRHAPLVHRKAKDLLRASGLELLPQTNLHVKKDLAKVADGQRLSPVLVVRGDLWGAVPLTVADGYHRICASYYLNEDSACPCRLVEHRPAGAQRD